MIEDSKLAQPRYNGLVHGVKLMVREEGYRGIYRGVGPVVSRSTPLYWIERYAADSQWRL